MIIQPKKRGDLKAEFLAVRGQYSEPIKEKLEHQVKKVGVKTAYESFLIKFKNFEEHLSDFSTRDLVYYFREVAKENGYKYTISNIKKDMAIIKRLRESYSNMEICCMIEFLYTSDQDYLDKSRLSINLLASQWINTIYADTALWCENKYIPKSRKKNYSNKGEWNSDDSSTNVGMKL